MEQLYIGTDLAALRVSMLLEENRRLREQLASSDHRTEKASTPRTVSTEWSEFKSNGGKKATKACSVTSYWDVKAISDWFYENGQYRNWALWRCGIAFGLRFSDLVSLRWRQVVSPSGEFCTRIRPVERKTQKRQNCLITEVVRLTLAEYARLTHNPMEPDAYVFPASTKGKGDGTTPLTTSQGCRILKAAAEACHLSFHVSTHTMRKSMVNIACCVGNLTVDSGKFALARSLLNHSSEATTMAYLDRLNPLMDEARIVVSDFILGKTDEKDLVWDSRSAADVIAELLKEVNDDE